MSSYVKDEAHDNMLIMSVTSLMSVMSLMSTTSDDDVLTASPVGRQATGLSQVSFLGSKVNKKGF